MRFYSNTAVGATLDAGVNTIDTSIVVDVTTGFPDDTPFTLAIDADDPAEELVNVTAVGGTTLTVERGYDGTTAVNHDPGAVVRHVHSAADFEDSRLHQDASGNVHGIGGASDVVGTATTQTLTNKTLTSPTLNTPTVVNPTTSDGTFTTPTITNPTINGTLVDDTGWVGLGGPAASGNFEVGAFEPQVRRIGNEVWLKGQLAVVAANSWGDGGTWLDLYTLDADFQPADASPGSVAVAYGGDTTEDGVHAQLVILPSGVTRIVNNGTAALPGGSVVAIAGHWLVD